MPPFDTRVFIVSATVKQRVIDLIEGLPEDASLEDIVAELYFHQKVSEGLRQLDAGDGIDHEEAKKRLGKWLDSSGRPAP